MHPSRTRGSVPSSTEHTLTYASWPWVATWALVLSHKRLAHSTATLFIDTFAQLILLRGRKLLADS